MRRMACRQFNVFDRVCVEGEDAFHTRRKGVLTPMRGFADAAFDRLPRLCGIKVQRERRDARRTGRVHALARVLRELHWSRLAERMGEGVDV